MCDLKNALYRRGLESVALKWQILLLYVKKEGGKKSKKQAPEKESDYVLLTVMVVGVVFNRGYKEGNTVGI